MDPRIVERTMFIKTVTGSAIASGIEVFHLQNPEHRGLNEK